MLDREDTVLDWVLDGLSWLLVGPLEELLDRLLDEAMRGWLLLDWDVWEELVDWVLS